MLACISVAIALVQGQVQLITEEIRIQHGRATKILREIESTGLGFKVVADDRKGVLRVTGTREQVNELQTFVSMFDIKLASVALQVNIDSEIDKAHFAATISGKTNTNHSISDGGTGVELSLTPKLNGDGTVTLFLKLEYEAKSASVVARVMPGQKLVLDPSGVYYTDSPTRKQGLNRAERSILPQVTITFVTYGHENSLAPAYIPKSPTEMSVRKFKLIRGDAKLAFDRIDRKSLRGVDYLSYDPTDNSLVARGTEAGLQALKKRIEELDRNP
jgi:type II secretory pathway component GspD/PulD (secretin)